MKRRIRNFFICLFLGAATVHGATVRPDDVNALMEALNGPRVAHVLPEEREGGDDL